MRVCLYHMSVAGQSVRSRVHNHAHLCDFSNSLCGTRVPMLSGFTLRWSAESTVTHLCCKPHHTSAASAAHAHTSHMRANIPGHPKQAPCMLPRTTHISRHSSHAFIPPVCVCELPLLLLLLGQLLALLLTVSPPPANSCCSQHSNRCWPAPHTSTAATSAKNPHTLTYTQPHTIQYALPPEVEAEVAV
jgi:hypothetical protein